MNDSNTCPEPRSLLFRWLRGLCLCLMWVGCVQAARASEVKGEGLRYTHRRYDVAQGLPEGPVSSIAQTPDGYLWLGTATGLLRFDGLSFRRISENRSVGAIDHVLSLVVDDKGVLWIRMEGPRLLLYRNGRFETDTSLRSEAGVTAIAPSVSGGVLLSALNNGNVRSDGSHVTELAPSTDALVISIAQTLDQRVWLGTRGAGLLYLDGKNVVTLPAHLADNKVNCLLPSRDGRLWIGTDSGLAVWDGHALQEETIPPLFKHLQILAMLMDRRGNLWVGTAHGLVRYNAEGAAWFHAGEPELDEAVNALYEDREGNIWSGGSRGIELLRESPFATFSNADGLPRDSHGALATDDSGRTWFTGLTRGLYWFQHGVTHAVLNAGLDNDVVYSIGSGQGDELWVGRQRGGLTHLIMHDGKIDEKTYTQADGLVQNSIYSVAFTRDGSVWAGSLTAGVSHFIHGAFKNYSKADGLASNSISAMEEGKDGTMWFATSNGLSSLSKNAWRTYTEQDGLPSREITSLFSDSHGTMWIGTSQGIAFVDQGKLHAPSVEPDSLQDPILGITEDRLGSLWVLTSKQLLRVKSGSLRSEQITKEDVSEFGVADGLYGTEGAKRDRLLVTDSKGRVWVSMSKGLTLVTPEWMDTTPSPAISHIDGILLDGSPVEPDGTLHISSGRHRISFNYTGISLSSPERVRYRYRLDGFDHAWTEALENRQATYTNLSPGSYRFRVIASNRDGHWSGPEGSFVMDVEPLFWQTTRFRVVCGLALVFVIVTLYRVRMYQVTRQVSMRFEERLAERTRIARELHDTLLQGFFSASLQLNTATEQVPRDSPAAPMLHEVQTLMDQVIEEGRNAVRGLRLTDAAVLNLEQAFHKMLEDMAGTENARCRVSAKGTPMRMHAMIYDEVCRIGREALINAFRHSKADTIEVEIVYGSKDLVVRFCDNGCGIDPSILHAGRDGHWGLAGMRERAARIGAKLQFRGRNGGGTEVRITVPSQTAFRKPMAMRFFDRLMGGIFPQSRML